MFPTGVGMNRGLPVAGQVGRDVPHRRGDEPGHLAVMAELLVCSPQAWG